MLLADVKNDAAFRKIFGNSQKTEILISFLNAILKLEGTRRISQISILTPHQMPFVMGAKSSILDVKAKDESGHEYIVEMQLTDKIGFSKRVTYYSAKSYTSQLGSGEGYPELKPIIFIGILDFIFLESPSYLSKHLILNTETGEHKLKDLDFNFIELPKFSKTESELANLTEKWIYFIKNANKLQAVPSGLDDAGLQAAYREANRHGWTKKELEEYDYALLRETDTENEKKLVELRGEQRGLQQGDMKARKEVAQNLILLGLTNEQIIQATGLSLEQIKQLR